MKSSNPIIQDIYDALIGHADTMVIRNGGDGCWLNSHIACELIKAQLLVPYEISFEKTAGELDRYFSPKLAGSLKPGTSFNCNWIRHIVPGCKMDGQMIIFDPLLFETPVEFSEYSPIFGEKVVHSIRDSSLSTYAIDQFGQALTVKDMVISINRDTGLSEFISSHGERYSGPVEDFDHSKAGPTLNQFIERALTGCRHKGMRFESRLKKAFTLDL